MIHDVGWNRVVGEVVLGAISGPCNDGAMVITWGRVGVDERYFGVEERDRQSNMVNSASGSSSSRVRVCHKLCVCFG